MFQELAANNNVTLDISPKLIEIFKEGISLFGENKNSPAIIQRLERKTYQNAKRSYALSTMSTLLE